MSSGKISDDRKTLWFEVNKNGINARFALHHMDGNELNPDRICMKLSTEGYLNNSKVDSSNYIVIDKEYTEVLSHWFRHAADVMDEWYKKDESN